METAPKIDDLRQAVLDQEARRRASGTMFYWEVDGHVEAQFAAAEDQESWPMLCPACHRHKTQLFTQGLARND